MTREPDGLVWHYTSAAGVLGILEHKDATATEPEEPYTLQATNIRHMNDASEFAYFADFVFREIEANFWLTDPGFADTAKSAVEHMTTHAGVFLVSFCNDGDLLSQWRGYGGTGRFAVGFDRGALMHARSTTTGILVTALTATSLQRNRQGASYSGPTRRH